MGIQITSEIKDRFGNIEIIVVYPKGDVWSYTLDAGFWFALKKQYPYNPGKLVDTVKKSTPPNLKSSEKLQSIKDDKEDATATARGKAFLDARWKSPAIRKAAGLDESFGYGKYDGWYKLNGAVELVRTAHDLDLYTRYANFGISKAEYQHIQEQAKRELAKDKEEGIMAQLGAQEQEWLVYLVCEALQPLVYERGWYKVRTLPEGLYVVGKHIQSNSVKNKLFFLLSRFYPIGTLVSPKTILADVRDPEKKATSFNESKDQKQKRALYEQMESGNIRPEVLTESSIRDRVTLHLVARQHLADMVETVSKMVMNPSLVKLHKAFMEYDKAVDELVETYFTRGSFPDHDKVAVNATITTIEAVDKLGVKVRHELEGVAAMHGVAMPNILN